MLLSNSCLVRASDIGVHSVVVPGGRITQFHGQYPSAPGNHTHLGLDIAAPVSGTTCTGKETPVHAFADGVVSEILLESPAGEGLAEWIGNSVMIEHTAVGKQTFYTTYLHLSLPPQDGMGVLLNRNDNNLVRVSKGQVIGYMGETGKAAVGCHVHFEVKLKPEWNGAWRIAAKDPDPIKDAENVKRNVYGLGNVTTSEPFEDNWVNYRDNWRDPIPLFCTYPEGMESGDALEGRCGAEYIEITGDNINARNGPNGAVIRTLDRGLEGRTLGGPVLQGEHWWWNADFGLLGNNLWVAGHLVSIARVVNRGESRAGFAMSNDGLATYRGQPLARALDPASSELRLSSPSPVRGLVYAVLWDADFGGVAARVVDPGTDKVVTGEIIKSTVERSNLTIEWSPTEAYAVVPPKTEQQHRIGVVDLKTGKAAAIDVGEMERDGCDLQVIELHDGEWVTESRLKFAVRQTPNPWSDSPCPSDRAFPTAWVTVDLASRTVANLEPSTEVVSYGACPFEGCQLGRWTARERSLVYDRPSGLVMSAIEPGQSVIATSAEVRATPRRGTVTAVYKTDEQQGIRTGEVAYALYPLGEGAMAVWHQGRIKHGSLDLTMRFADGVEEWRLTYTWWVEVQLPGGKTGWIKDPQGRFDGMDAFG